MGRVAATVQLNVTILHMAEQPDVTRLLLDWGSGDAAALDKLTPLLYDELRRLADSYLRRQQPGHTLQPTALVHEAYLRLADQTQLEWRNRAHCFGIAAKVMRQILVDHFRTRHAAKRGGGGVPMALDELEIAAPGRGSDIGKLDNSLRELETN